MERVEERVASGWDGDEGEGEGEGGEGRGGGENGGEETECNG